MAQASVSVPAVGAASAAGTPVAEAAKVPAPDSPNAQVWRDRNRYFASRARSDHNVARVMVVAMIAAALAVLAHGGLPAWRVGALAIGMVLLQITQITLIGRAIAPHRVGRVFFLLNLTGLLYQVSFVALTGGLHSPMTPWLTMSIVLALFFFGPHALTWQLTGILAVLCAGLAVLPAEVTGPSLPSGHYVAVMLIGLGFTILMLTMIVRKLHEASEHALLCLDDAREARVADAEAQTRRLQAVGSKVAHELKNPLAAIKGLIQLVARTPDSERTQERLAVVQAEISRMETILTEYLSFARPLEDLRPEAVDLAALATDVAGVLAGRLDQGRLTLAVDARPTPLSGDPRRLREAFINLLTNAVEATPAGGTIRVRTRPHGTGGVLEIEDNGRGIPEADLARLGTSYFTTREGGTGLGVVLVHGVVAQHGGTLTYDSAPGRGTIVKVELPATPPTSEPLPPAPPVLASTGSAPDCAMVSAFRRRVVERGA